MKPFSLKYYVFAALLLTVYLVSDGRSGGGGSQGGNRGVTAAPAVTPSGAAPAGASFAMGGAQEVAAIAKIATNAAATKNDANLVVAAALQDESQEPLALFEGILATDEAAEPEVIE
jgi:hypothetical protein